MPQFRVGDRVRRIEQNDNDRMPIGTEWIVSRIVNEITIQVENDPVIHATRTARWFELVQPEAPRPGTVFYSVVFRPDPGAILKVIGFETELSFDDWMRRAPRMGYEIICKKKLTLTLPNQEA